MKNFKLRLKRRALKRAVQIKDAINTYIQPFTETPSVDESADRISAHDLFSHYTADIIKEDIIFVR